MSTKNLDNAQKKPASLTVEAFPEIFKELISKPKTLSITSKEKVTWRCTSGHQWETQLRSRFRKNSTIKLGYSPSSCPECLLQSKKLLRDEKWFDSKNWSTKNPPLSVVTSGSGKKYFWTGECGHEWKRLIVSFRKNQTCPYCTDKELLSGFNDLETKHPELIKEWDWDKNTLHPREVFYKSGKLVWWQCDKGHSWESYPWSRTIRNNKCFKCSVSCRTSVQEQELISFLSDLGVEFSTSNRSIIPPKELDIYIPNNKIAIEFNGLYWHSEENGKPRNYHYDKWLSCKEKDIQLIQIWEDDWKYRNDIVKAMIRHKLNLNLSEKVGARKTTVEEVDFHEAESFMEKYHIQGSAKATIRLGLWHEETLVACMLLTKKTKDEYLITRYATSCNVVGGFSKLLKYTTVNFPQIKTLTTFSDNTISDGELYRANGFILERILPPDYMYIVDGERRHKFNYRLKKFKNNSSLKWKEDLTEKELASLNGLMRLWDAGKVKWIKPISS